MFRRMRIISAFVLSVTLLMLLICRVVPHHHHTLHISGTSLTVELIHFGIEICDDGHNHSHHQHHKCECPSNDTLYYVSACDELDIYKSTSIYDFQPIILAIEAMETVLPPADIITPQYIPPKIPDEYKAGTLLRAPPTVC